MSDIDVSEAELQDRLNAEYEADPNVHIASLAIDVRDFWNSRVGQYIAAQCDHQIDEALQEMLKLDPEDYPKEFRKLQLRVNVAKAVPEWIEGLYQSAAVAEATLREEDSFDSHTS